MMLFGSDRFPILAQVLGKYMVAVDLTLHNYNQVKFFIDHLLQMSIDDLR